MSAEMQYVQLIKSSVKMQSFTVMACNRTTESLCAIKVTLNNDYCDWQMHFWRHSACSWLVLTMYSLARQRSTWCVQAAEVLTTSVTGDITTIHRSFWVSFVAMIRKSFTLATTGTWWR